jgi:hypothetical protein
MSVALIAHTNHNHDVTNMLCWLFGTNAFFQTWCKLEKAYSIGVTYIDHLKALKQSAKGKRARISTEGWELALNIAEGCRKKFMENVATIKDMEVKSTEALEFSSTRRCLSLVLVRNAHCTLLLLASVPFHATRHAQQSNKAIALGPAELKELACHTEYTAGVFVMMYAIAFLRCPILQSMRRLLKQSQASRRPRHPPFPCSPPELYRGPHWCYSRKRTIRRGCIEYIKDTWVYYGEW